MYDTSSDSMRRQAIGISADGGGPYQIVGVQFADFFQNFPAFVQSLTAQQDETQGLQGEEIKMGRTVNHGPVCRAWGELLPVGGKSAQSCPANQGAACYLFGLRQPGLAEQQLVHGKIGGQVIRIGQQMLPQQFFHLGRVCAVGQCGLQQRSGLPGRIGKGQGDLSEGTVRAHWTMPPGLTELEKDAVTAPWIGPIHVAIFRTDDPAGATLQAAVRGQDHSTSLVFGVTGGWTGEGAGLCFAIIRADLRIADLNMRPTFINPVAVLKQFLFDLDHRVALHMR
ncbi:protein of unknown function [Acidithiobacillus ferrivorans]|uniref:Uncharacterized protein n=1 Tax=Acidithiobacillus ferrivorans TaxID=160808 RepID=A0ABY1MKT1_9PROT|nr:protein of unknown function [Acidithiobacillus ferrivorans]